MTHAIFETGGKQYRVKEGDEIFIEKLEAEEGEKVKFDNVLAIVKEGDQKFGTPYIKGASVAASIIKSGKAKKIVVYKMHAKKGYRRKQGHRQPYTKVKIEKIALKATKAKDEVKEDGA